MKYRFAEYELDCGRRELLRDGRPVNVEPQVFDILRYFTENPDRLVSRDELMEKIWAPRVVSDSTLSARISAARRAIGDNGRTQRFIKTISRNGFRFDGSVTATADTAPPEASRDQHQTVRYATSRDGTSIAFAQFGSGDPIVLAGHWITHLEHDWKSPLWRPHLDELGSRFHVTRYDQRGNGLSKWNVEDFSLEAFVDDLDAVIAVSGLQRFALYGRSQGAPVAIAYAHRHPERVSRLLLQGGYMRGRSARGSEADRSEAEALLTLIKLNWGKPGGHFLKAFASMLIPGGTREQIDSLAELQAISASPENAARIRQAIDRFDVSDLVAELRTPTLVLHSRDDGLQPFDQGKQLAARIPNARLLMLESPNHVILKQEPAWATLHEGIAAFVKGEPGNQGNSEQ